ncbi:HAMP domain-containing protein [Psychrosphaera sp. B3R10]|uniref:HAMP domain-containing sensor histidine kinase n=1 Tax=unclassified Psychrosphaera TaxID=2641570 RepID=UPI001C09E332|nr:MULTISPECIES: ATP-binding protein [unclassified Psychrosphaera]MBU2880431.1 HAMP domain-containing protein [Psychrosphaera sp. I2R16]MBU2987870.1 HAMP domain-containing protein [Psychrosphaera sp. B3R10]
MHKWLQRISNINISIKTLTLLGFSLVALPLVFAFLYSAKQVNNLSQQGTSAIFNVAELVERNRKVSHVQSRLERFAGQYAVLKDDDLLDSFKQQCQLLESTLSSSFNSYKDKALIKVIQSYLWQLKKIRDLLAKPHALLQLEDVQVEFRTLAKLNQQLALRSNQLVNNQAHKMMRSAARIEQTMFLSLYTIPITLIIAVIFITLIIQPLKRLQSQIKRLEQGNFKQPITLRGSTEMVEIAEALELMRCRLHELELQKSSFIRHISHELKTPLAAIREGTELIYDNSVGELNQAQQEITDIIRLSVSRLQMLIEDLLDFNIVLDSTSLQDTQFVDINKLVEECLELRRLDINRKKLTVQTQINSVALQCNSKQLNVVVDNLLSNAIKFSPSNGVIKIKASNEEDRLVFSMTDQGPGIPTTAFDDVFTAFYQGPTKHNSPIKSSGLGLTIVKELLMRLNGNITINSDTASPSFTQFVIQLPLTRQVSQRQMESRK